MTFIELTNKDGRKILINTAFISSVYQSFNDTKDFRIINMSAGGDEFWEVKESMSEILFQIGYQEIFDTFTQCRS